MNIPMKRIWIMALLLSLIMSAAGCEKGSEEHFDVYSIQSYREIPGVTEEEIAAVEKLKAERESFSYGNLPGTEALILPDGTHSGFTAKLCGLFSDLFGIKFIQEFYEWDDLKSRLDNKLIDFTGDLTPTPERMEVYHMSYAVAERSQRIFFNADSPDIKDESALNGLTVGFLAGSADAATVAKFYPELDYEIADCSDFDDAANKLQNHEIDVFVTAGVLDPAFDSYDFIRSKNFFPLIFEPVSVTTAVPELKPVISVVNKYLEAGGIDRLYELYKEGEEEYTKYKLARSFTDEEKAYINDLKARGVKVNAALEFDNYPISFYNKSEKQFQGIAADVLAEISRLTDIEFETVSDADTSWTEILEMLKSGEASVVSQLIYSEARKELFLFPEEPYSHTAHALISKFDYPNLAVYQVARAKVGNLANTAHEELYNSIFPNNTNSVSYQTQDEALAALEKGEIDLLMASENLLLAQTNYHEKPGYKININLKVPVESMFGLNKNETALCSIINKAQKFIKTDDITDSWTSRTYDYAKNAAHERSVYLLIFVVFLFLTVILMVMMLVKNKRLSKNLEETVNERTGELMRKTATLYTIFNSIPDLVFCKDINSVYTSCNSRFEKFAGMTEAELIGKTDIEIFKIDGEMAKLFIEADKKVLSGQNDEKIEELLTYPDGSQRLAETVKTPLIQNNEVIGMMGISRDITERKEAEANLEKRFRQQSLMTLISQSLLSGSDSDAEVLITNALRMTGEFMGVAQILFYKFEDEGVTLTCQNEWINPAYGLPTRIGSQLHIRGEMASLVEKLIVDRELCMNSNDPPINDAMAPYRQNFRNYITAPFYIKNKMYGALDFSKEDDGVLWSESDINLATLVSSILAGFFERHLIESELIAAKELAEQNSRAKSDFLSRMSHEMRTPMNAIIGMTSIGKSSSEIERKDYCLGKIDSASTHLLGVINDVLDISKIEAGKFDLSNTDFDLEKMFIKITNVVNFRMEEKSQTFAIKINPDVPRAIVSDEQRLSQIITNLLGNAIKFTPDNGSISLFVRRIAEEDGYYTLRFEVRDTGVGISEDQQKKLFAPFEQGDGSVSRKYGGTGLGLAISKHIVEMMEGRIWVESKLGEGSNFIFTIRVREGRCQTNLLRSDINLSGLRILAVDDDEDVREYFLSVAKPLDLQFEVAASGREACGMIDERGPYDVFFVDWKMDGMNGIELTKRIKNKYDKNSVVIMISSAEWSYIETEAKQAGVDRFIPKPLFASVITECIYECVNTRRNESADNAAEANGGDHFEGMRILLAEDVDINREIIAALLEPTGIQIDCAKDGEIAYRMFKENPDYDMIFMDIHMPEVDGYTSTKMIRALPEPRAKSVPIIAMTANVFREDIERCIEAGMNAHIGKPIDIEDVLEKLRRYLPKKPSAEPNRPRQS